MDEAREPEEERDPEDEFESEDFIPPEIDVPELTPEPWEESAFGNAAGAEDLGVVGASAVVIDDCDVDIRGFEAGSGGVRLEGGDPTIPTVFDDIWDGCLDPDRAGRGVGGSGCKRL